MVAIQPFRALRYNPDVVPDLSRLIAPPYDVIDPDEQERLYHASPYNIVRLILGRQSPADTPDDNRYTRAQRDFSAWQATRILQQDGTPAVYLIEHTFDDAGHPRRRLGFISLLSLEASSARAVLRHEATLAAPKADRTKLFDAVPANLEPIFCVYPDQGGTLHTQLDAITRLSPTAQATFHGDAIRLWVVTHAEIIRTLTQHLGSSTVLIADGHHRFEVAYANRARYGAVMSYFVSMADPSLIMRPIHRVVEQRPTEALQALRALCTIEPAASLSSLLEWLQRERRQGCFGFSDGTAFYQVAITADPLDRWLRVPTVAPSLAGLDVSILHGLLLPQLGLNGSSVRYSADAMQTLQMIQRGEGRSAWLLRALPLPQVFTLAAEGLTCPPKSTYFYPKVPSGLTINPWLR